MPEEVSGSEDEGRRGLEGVTRGKMGRVGTVPARLLLTEATTTLTFFL